MKIVLILLIWLATLGAYCQNYSHVGQPGGLPGADSLGMILPEGYIPFGDDSRLVDTSIHFRFIKGPDSLLVDAEVFMFGLPFSDSRPDTVLSILDGQLIKTPVDSVGGTVSGSSHDPVTLSGIYDYISLSGQDIVRGQIDLTTDVTGLLPGSNINSITESQISDLSHTTVSGSNTQVQFNDGGVFGADNLFTWIKASDQLGLGIATPAVGRKVHIHTDTPGGAETIGYTNQTTGTTITDGFYTGYGSGSAYFINFENTPIGFYTSGIERLTILGGGQVGIGTNAPETKLHIVGPGTGITQALISNSDYFGAENSVGTNIRLAGISGTDDVYLGAIDDAGGAVYIREDGANAITISGSRVGIGTGAVTTEMLNVYRPNSSGSAALFQNTSTGTGATDGLYVGTSSSNGYIWNYEAASIIFATSSIQRGNINAAGVFNIESGTSAASPTAVLNLGFYTDNAGDPSVSHISLWGNGAYGFGVTGSNLNYISGAFHSFYGTGSLSQRAFFVSGNTRNIAVNPASTTAWGTSSIGVLSIFNGTAPTGNVTDGIQLYAEDVAASSELKVRDEAGNISVLSPHNFSKIPGGPSEPMAWSFYSERDDRYITVDMLRVIRDLEKITGEKYIFEGKIDKK